MSRCQADWTLPPDVVVVEPTIVAAEAKSIPEGEVPLSDHAGVRILSDRRTTKARFDLSLFASELELALWRLLPPSTVQSVGRPLLVRFVLESVRRRTTVFSLFVPSCEPIAMLFPIGPATESIWPTNPVPADASRPPETTQVPEFATTALRGSRPKSSAIDLAFSSHKALVTRHPALVIVPSHCVSKSTLKLPPSSDYPLASLAEPMHPTGIIPSHTATWDRHGRSRSQRLPSSFGNNNPTLLKWTATTTISVICAISVGAVAAAAIAIVPPWHGEQRCAIFAGPPASPATQKKFYHCFSQLPPSGICLVDDDTKYSSCYYIQVRTRLSLHNILTDTDVLWKGDSRIQRRRGSIAPVPETAFIASGADGTAPGDDFLADRLSRTCHIRWGPLTPPEAMSSIRMAPVTFPTFSGPYPKVKASFARRYPT